MEYTEEMIKKINKNIADCEKWLLENRLNDESIIIHYNYNCDYNEYVNSLLIPSSGNEVSSSSGRYSVRNYCPIQKLNQPYEKYLILKDWNSIKRDFLDEKRRILEHRERVNHVIFDFKV